MTDNKITEIIACKHGNNASFRFEIDTKGGMVEILLCHRCEVMFRGIILQGMLDKALSGMPRASFVRRR